MFQTIKYLSRCRINGISIPANILLVSLNNRITYKFNSQDFLPQIETLYIGSASVNNESFSTAIKPEIIDYKTTSGGMALIGLLREEKYTKINIDTNCILGWATRYYRENPSANKGSFLGTKDHTLFPNDGEIRFPQAFKNFINPYKEKDNEKFKSLMDTLNDRLSKKELGAFYTPAPYCKMAVEMVRNAIKLVPEGNDYIILDRCCGTGNLEAFLTDEELSHCIISTYEYYEYKVLVSRLGSKVKMIIPPTDDHAIFQDGKIKNADAMSEEYIKDEYLQSIINNPKITIIMLENPPYRDVSTGRDTDVAQTNRTSFIKREMGGTASNDISNQFIYSAFKYYLRQPTDSYILFSPVKYFKSIGLVNKKFVEGKLLNRKHFHASASSISLIHWQNIDEEKQEFTLPAYDIQINEQIAEKQEQVDAGTIKFEKDVIVKKVFKTFVEYFDKRKFDDDIRVDVWCAGDGCKQKDNVKVRVASFYNQNILGYLIAQSFVISAENINLLRNIQYNGNGFYLRSDNFIEKLPLFCAKLYPQEKWYEKDVYFTTSDGGLEYTKDAEFLKACFIFTCLSQRNKCISFTGNDGRFYRNELCFESDTLASKHLETLKTNNEDKKLLDLYKEILEETYKTKECNANLKYGTYHIIQEINTFYLDDKGTKIYNYPILNTKINLLKNQLKEYYANQIEQKLFKYELLK